MLTPSYRNGSTILPTFFFYSLNAHCTLEQNDKQINASALFTFSMKRKYKLRNAMNSYIITKEKYKKITTYRDCLFLAIYVRENT